MKIMIKCFLLAVAALLSVAAYAAPFPGHASASTRVPGIGVLNGTHIGSHIVRRMGSGLRPRAFVIDESGGDYYPWLKMNPGADIVVIPYCYYDDISYKYLGPVMVEAQKRWEKALGANRGIMFEEGGKGDADRNYCADKHGNWNKNAPDIGMLVLEWVPDEVGVYVPGAGCKQVEEGDEDPFRNTLEFDLNRHVLGFQHEHQRQDASKHILFKCENLDDYEHAKEWIAKEKPGFTIEEACSDSVKADDVREVNKDGQATWAFSARDFASFDKGNTDTKYDGDFDIDSVMMYGSEARSKNSDDSVRLWPIQKSDGSRLVAKNVSSGLNIAAVNKIYPQKSRSSTDL